MRPVGNLLASFSLFLLPCPPHAFRQVVLALMILLEYGAAFAAMFDCSSKGNVGSKEAVRWHHPQLLPPVFVPCILHETIFKCNH